MIDDIDGGAKDIPLKPPAQAGNRDILQHLQSINQAGTGLKRAL